MLAILFALVTAPTAPSLPPGTHIELHRTVLAIEKELSKGMFEEAYYLSKQLPNRVIKVEWDDSLVPSTSSEVFRKARDRAFAAWIKAVPSLKISIEKRGDIAFRFVESIPVKPGDPQVAASFMFIAGPPRLLVDLSLARREGKTGHRDVENETLFALGSYLGASPAIVIGQAMGRTDEPSRSANRVTPAEASIVSEVLNASDTLRTAIALKQKIEPASPKLEVTLPKVQEGKVLQGTRVERIFKVKNSGNATLRVRLGSTCGCLAGVSKETIAAGETTDIKAVLDTSDYSEDIEKLLILYTNDPEEPVKKLKVGAGIEPYYRLVGPAVQAIAVDGETTTFSCYLVPSKQARIDVLAARIDGIVATADFRPWKGKLKATDAEELTGTEIIVTVKDPNLVGRAQATLVLTTNEARYETLRLPLVLQRGIAVLPTQVYFGRLSSQEADAVFSIVSTGKPFGIAKVETTHPNLRAIFEAGQKASEHRIKLIYDGKAKKGNLQTYVKITLSDASQKEVIVQVMGFVE